MFIKRIISCILYYCGLSGLILRICLRIKPAKLIMMYHRLSDKDNGVFPGIKPTNFERQISVLKKFFKVITLSEFAELRNSAKDSLAVITFDDGYKNTYTKAFPVLKDNGIPATVFLTTGPIDNRDMVWTDKLNLIKKNDASLLEATKNNLKNMPNSMKEAKLNKLLSQSSINIDSLPHTEKMLSWEEVTLMNSEGIEFGSHTVNHPILTKISLDEAKKEIKNSKYKIELETGKPVTTFCYPNGMKSDFNDDIKQILKESGFKCAVTSVEGKVNDSDDNLALKRISLGDRHPGLAILKIIKEVLKNA